MPAQNSNLVLKVSSPFSLEFRTDMCVSIVSIKSKVNKYLTGSYKKLEIKIYRFKTNDGG